MAPLEIDNLNPSFLSRRTWFSKRDLRIHSSVFTFFSKWEASFFGFSIISSKRIRQHQDLNRQPPDLLHDKLDHRTTVPCYWRILLSICILYITKFRFPIIVWYSNGSWIVEEIGQFLDHHLNIGSFFRYSNAHYWSHYLNRGQFYLLCHWFGKRYRPEYQTSPLFRSPLYKVIFGQRKIKPQFNFFGTGWS